MKKVFISAGHGGSDPGAVAYGMKEKDINLNIVLSCAEVLTRHGVIVILSRTNDENDPVSQEVKEANASGADIAWSCHTNAGKGDGSESFSLSTTGDGRKLALLCEKHVQAIGQNSRGAKVRKDLYFLKHTKMPATLSECAFIDNDKDNDAIDTLAEQKKFGVAYAKAILEYFGIPYQENATSKPTTTSGSKDGCPFLVKFKETMNVRVNPGVKNKTTGKENEIKGVCKKGYKYTIVETTKVGTVTWGKLKSGLGWVSIAAKYCDRV